MKRSTKGDATSAAAKLRAFIQRFSKRPDIRITTSKLGEAASADALEPFRGKIPSELFAFLSEMNGVHFEWQFVEPPGGGNLQIPALSEWTLFKTDDEQKTSFGEGRLAILLDVHMPECQTWYVLPAGKSPDDAILWFTKYSSLHDGKLIAKTFAEYIDLAIDHGFVWWWQTNGFPDAIARVRAKPVKPVVLAVGRRVHSSEYGEGVRGVIEEIRGVPPGRDRYAYLGDTFARVRHDHGGTRWVPALFLKGVSRIDEYEDAVARGAAYWTELCAKGIPDRLEAVARAIGPHSYYSTGRWGPSNARRAAGMLSSLELSEAVDIVASAFGDAGRLMKGGVPLREERPIPKSDRDFDPTEWKTQRHNRYVPADVLEGMIAGLGDRVRVASAEKRVPPRSLVPDAAAKLRPIVGYSQWMQPLVESETPVELPSPPGDDLEIRDAIGLPGPWPLATGNGR